jgi:hypothetical protein
MGDPDLAGFLVGIMQAEIRARSGTGMNPLQGVL